MMTKERSTFDELESRLLSRRDLTRTGYAGVNRDGAVVDRREFPDAVPFQEMGIPAPKPITENQEAV